MLYKADTLDPDATMLNILSFHQINEHLALDIFLVLLK